MSARRRGKDAERRVAKLTGGQRVGVTGKTGPDVVTSRYVIEVKCTTGDGIRSSYVVQARDHARRDRRGRDWLLWHTTPGSPRFTVTLEHEHFLELLRMAGIK